MAADASMTGPRFLIVAVVVLLGISAAYLTRRSRPLAGTAAFQERPQIRLELPDFTLTDSSGRPLGKHDLEGSAWIADFVFTSCAGPCPQMSRAMRRLQDDLAGVENLRLVSFSVDPERDTPEVLSAYAERYGADPQRWLFVTGPMSQIYDLAIDGFKIAVEEDRENQRIIHDTRFILVDREGAIRGYYDSTSGDGMARLRREVLALARKKP